MKSGDASSVLRCSGELIQLMASEFNGSCFGYATRHCKRRKMMLALTPPKPKPFEIACSMGMRLASRATMSTPWAAVSPLSRLRVGGATDARRKIGYQGEQNGLSERRSMIVPRGVV
jgi:hypothetical protein